MGFSLLAKDLFQTKDKFGIVVTGILIGEVSVGDNIYILRPEADYRGVVIRIDQNTDGKTYQTDHGVTGSAALPDQNDSSKQRMPLFTDWGQLNRWEGLVQEDKKIKTVILTFPDVAGSLSSGGFDGIVINPFCEQPISVDSSMINSITNLDGYKMEFGN